MLHPSILSHLLALVIPILELPTSHKVFWAAVAYAALKSLIVLYRISPLHPLAKVPGPAIAAATLWYRTYHEVWPHSGCMRDELERLHKVYGPVVRMSPNEVHFSSPSAYLHIYSSASKALKDPTLYKSFNVKLSSAMFCDPATARQRRDLLSPFFSRRNILSLEHVIEDKLCLLSHQLLYNANTSPGHVIDLSCAVKSFTIDVIMEFCFASTLDTLKAPGFGHPLLRCAENTAPMLWVFKNFPLIKHILLQVPNGIATWLSPDISGMLELMDLLQKQVDSFVKNPEEMGTVVGHEVIYHRLLGLKNSTSKGADDVTGPVHTGGEKISGQSLYDEAQTLVLAGSDTVGNTLAIGSFYILNSPGVVEKLVEELRKVWPGDPWIEMPTAGEQYEDGSGRLPVRWEILEKLPFLGAVIKESLRLSHGAVSPLPRLAPPQGINVDGWTFPHGTGISSSSTFIHLNATIFPDPHTFRPERWLGPNQGDLERYLVSFSRGPRQCLGVNLAWCELYLSFATLYRRFEFELFETTHHDISFRDFLLPSPNGRIRVRVRERRE